MSIFFEIVLVFLKFLKVPIIFCLCFFVLFFVLVYLNVFFNLFKGKRFKKGKRKKIKKRSIIIRLFFDFPKRIADDLLEKNPDDFPYHGVVIFEGRQGRGKTIAMCQFARQMKEQFSNSKCLSNLDFKYEDKEINHWRDLLDYNNGHKGVIVLLDETQNWFSSNQSKDFPPEMLSVITQNRKNSRIILGTAQNFYLLAKAIRSQCTEVRRCTTLLGALTIVRRFEPYLDSEGNVKDWKYRGMYFFVHDKELRNSYDTYNVINSLSKSGFKPIEQTINNTTNIVIENIKKKK